MAKVAATPKAGEKGTKPATSKASPRASIDFLSGLNTTDERPIIRLPLDSIEPDPNQPRRTWHAADGIIPDSEQAALENLAEDIRENDVHTPIIVREVGPGRYMIVVGERRWRASRLAQKTSIPCIVRQDLAGSSIKLIQLSENVQRENMTDLDTARFVKDILEEYPDLQKRNLAKLLNKHPSYVSRMMAFVDQRWSHIVNTGIITYASVLEQFRSLPGEVQDQLVESAKNSGKPILAGDVQQAKKQAMPAAVSSNVEPDEVPGIDEAMKNQRVEGETYQRQPESLMSSTAYKAGDAIKDRGSEIVNNLPTHPDQVQVQDDQIKIQEVKLSLGQLAKLLDTIPVADDVPVTIPLRTDLMRQAVERLGGQVPDDTEWLSMALIDNLK